MLFESLVGHKNSPFTGLFFYRVFSALTGRMLFESLVGHKNSPFTGLFFYRVFSALAGLVVFDSKFNYRDSLHSEPVFVLEQFTGLFVFIIG